MDCLLPGKCHKQKFKQLLIQSLTKMSLGYEWGDLQCFGAGFFWCFLQISSLLVCSIHKLESSNKSQIRRNAEEVFFIYQLPENFLNLLGKTASERNVGQVFRAFPPHWLRATAGFVFPHHPVFEKGKKKRERPESIAFHWIMISTESWVMLVKKTEQKKCQHL